MAASGGIPAGSDSPTTLQLDNFLCWLDRLAKRRYLSEYRLNAVYLPFGYIDFIC
jgi:hypothetical protein